MDVFDCCVFACFSAVVWTGFQCLDEDVPQHTGADVRSDHRCSDLTLGGGGGGGGGGRLLDDDKRSSRLSTAYEAHQQANRMRKNTSATITEMPNPWGTISHTFLFLYFLSLFSVKDMSRAKSNGTDADHISLSIPELSIYLYWGRRTVHALIQS